MKHLIFAIGYTIILVAAACHPVHAAEPLPEYAPITESCYYTSQHGAPTESCAANREEAEDYFAKRHWSCSYIIYVIWQGSRETVRCRGFDGGVIDYISGTDGNLHTR